MTVFSVVVPVLALVALVYIAVRSNTAWMWGFLALSLAVLAIRLVLTRRRQSRTEHPRQ